MHNSSAALPELYGKVSEFFQLRERKKGLAITENDVDGTLSIILGDPGATSRDDVIFDEISHRQISHRPD